MPGSNTPRPAPLRSEPCTAVEVDVLAVSSCTLASVSKYYPVAEIHGIEDGGEHADIRLGTGNRRALLPFC